ncbi:hypothetical protein D3C75_798190 [compost metagenome]
MLGQSGQQWPGTQSLEVGDTLVEHGNIEDVLGKQAGLDQLADIQLAQGVA